MGSSCSQDFEKVRSAFKILTGTLTRRRPLGRPSRRLEHNIIMGLKEIDIIMRHWNHSVLDI